MKMRVLLMLLLLQTSFMAHAIEYAGHDPQKILTVSEQNGQRAYGLDMRYLDRMLQDLSQRAGHYPPSFDSAEEKQRVTHDLEVLSGMLNLLLKDGKPNPQILFRAAMTNRMAHNLDIPGSAEKAEQQFKMLLKEEPESPQGNYQFGVFLAETGRAKQSIPYLEKALAMGISEANYSLGMVYLSLGNKEEALSRLNLYSRTYPNDGSVKQIITAVESGQGVVKSRSP